MPSVSASHCRSVIQFPDIQIPETGVLPPPCGEIRPLQVLKFLCFVKRLSSLPAGIFEEFCGQSFPGEPDLSDFGPIVIIPADAQPQSGVLAAFNPQSPSTLACLDRGRKSAGVGLCA
jgi:hypothetical protein